jgi:hypothetical protein
MRLRICVVRSLSRPSSRSAPSSLPPRIDRFTTPLTTANGSATSNAPPSNTAAATRSSSAKPAACSRSCRRLSAASAVGSPRARTDQLRARQARPRFRRVPRRHARWRICLIAKPGDESVALRVALSRLVLSGRLVGSGGDARIQGRSDSDCRAADCVSLALKRMSDDVAPSRHEGRRPSPDNRPAIPAPPSGNEPRIQSLRSILRRQRRACPTSCGGGVLTARRSRHRRRRHPRHPPVLTVRRRR